MRIFKDNAGRDWAVEVHVTAARRCKALAGVDLYGLIGKGMRPLGRLMADPVRLADVLYVLCKDEAEARGVSDEAFGRALSGDAIMRAAEAFLGALTDFFPDPRVRGALTRLLAAGESLRGRLADHLDAEIAGFDEEAEFKKALDRLKSRRSSGGAPASSGSTPGPSPSASSA